MESLERIILDSEAQFGRTFNTDRHNQIYFMLFSVYICLCVSSTTRFYSFCYPDWIIPENSFTLRFGKSAENTRFQTLSWGTLLIQKLSTFVHLCVVGKWYQSRRVKNIHKCLKASFTQHFTQHFLSPDFFFTTGVGLNNFSFSRKQRTWSSILGSHVVHIS